MRDIALKNWIIHEIEQSIVLFQTYDYYGNYKALAAHRLRKLCNDFLKR